MRKETDKKLVKFLILAFVIAWIMQGIASVLFAKGITIGYSLVLAVSMFAPLLAALISGYKLKGMGWKPHLKGKIKYLFIAWFVPAILGAVGAALYFVLFPNAYDSSYSYIYTQIGDAGVAQLEAQGLTVPLYVVIGCVSAVAYAPWINMFTAVGEEAGWRGVLYPELKERFGRSYGRIIGGAIWGAWHWPIMLLTGYEYGKEYWGAPVTGMLLFCIICIAMGIIFDALYEKTACIWIPALAHGAINAFASTPLLFTKPECANNLLVGPLMIGIVSGLPMIIVAVVITVRTLKSEK